MARINIVLTALLVVCALLAVSSQYRTRRLTIELERAQGQGRELDVRESQLKVVIAERASEARIDARARGELKMIALRPERLMPAKDLR